jgi:hypothetical protein
MGATAYYCSGSLDSSTILAIFIASLRAVSCAAAIVFAGLWMVRSLGWFPARQSCAREGARVPQRTLRGRLPACMAVKRDIRAPRMCALSWPHQTWAPPCPFPPLCLPKAVNAIRLSHTSGRIRPRVQARRGLMTNALAKGLSEFSVKLAIPCLLFSSVVPGVSPMLLAYGWPLMLLPAVYLLVGAQHLGKVRRP